ncbi:MAG TPA: fatty acid desaturase, partial [Polyangiaceae bacterium]|nr:fatty acid desaturase [Polyangiaceae bacterium]
MTTAAAPESDRELEYVDYEGFAREITSMRREILERISSADLNHLKRVERWGRLCSLLGYTTAWLAPNPLSALLISQGNLTRWMVMHHVGHRGYDRVPGVPRRYTSEVFAMGWRRYIDWFDWIVPEAWNYEHNTLHHYYTGEQQDPDLVERNLDFLRRMKAPLWIRYVVVLLLAVSWKLYYYAPTTLLRLQKERQRRAGVRATSGPTYAYALFNPFSRAGGEFWRRCLLPYATVRFAVLPALFLPLGVYTGLGAWPAVFVLLNTILAETFTNLHAFI